MKRNKPSKNLCLIQTRVDVEVAEKIELEARKEGLSIAAYVRRLLIQKAIKISA